MDRVGELDSGSHREVVMSSALQTVDHSALKVNQTGIIVTVLVAVIGSAFFTPLI